MNTKNKVRLFLLSFILVLTISNVPINAVSAAQTQVIFVNAGAGNGGTLTTLSVAYPISGLQAGDLLLCQVVILVTTISLTSVSSFSSLLGPYTAGTDSRTWIYYKYSTGSESGSVTVTRATGTAGMIARIYQFRNTAQIIGDAYEAVNWANLGSVSTIVDTGVTTTGPLELAVNLVTVGEDANTYTDFTGESGGDWTESIAQYSNAAGNDGTIQIQCATMATAGTVNGGSYAMGASDPAGVLGVALKPEVASGEEYEAFVYEGITVSGTQYSSSDYVIRHYDEIQNDAQNFLSVSYILSLYDAITLQSSTISSLVLSKVIFESLTVLSDIILSIDFTVIFQDALIISSSFIQIVSYIIQFFEFFAIASSITITIKIPEIVYLFESISIFASFTTKTIVPTIVSFFDSIVIYASTSYYAGAVTFVNIAETIILIELSISGELMTDIFYQLFLSTGIGGLIGPFALLIVGFALMTNKKYKPLGGLWIILELIVIAQYFTLLETDVAYWWHIIILSLGVILSIFQSLR